MAKTPHIGTQKFLANYTIFRQGDTGDLAYVILSGKVKLIRKTEGKEEVLAEVGAGGVFGELALIDSKPRSATAVTTEPTVCNTIDKYYIQEKIRESDKVIQILFKLMMNLIRQKTDAKPAEAKPDPTAS